MPATASVKSKKPVRTKPAAATTSTKSATQRGIRPEDLLTFRYVSDAQISPSGAQVAFVEKKCGEKNAYQTNLWVVETEGKKQARQLTFGNKDRSPRWSADGAQIAFVRDAEKGRPQIHVLPLSEPGEARALTRLTEGSIGEFKWSPDGSAIAFTYREQDPEWTTAARKQREEKGLCDPPRVLTDWWYRLDGDGYFNAQRFLLYVVDTVTGGTRTVYAQDTMGGISFDWSPDGKHLAVTTNRDPRAMVEAEKDEILVLNAKTGATAARPKLPPGPKDRVIWSPDGKWLAYGGRIGKDSTYSTENLELFVCDPWKGNARSLTGKTDYCLQATSLSDSAEAAFAAIIRWSADSKRVYMQIGWHAQSHIASVSVDSTSGRDVVMHTQGAATHNLGNLSADGRRAALTIAEPTRLDEVAVVNFTGSAKSNGTKSGAATVTRLTDFNGPTLAQFTLSVPQEHWVTAADGWKVQTFVIVPVGAKTGKKHPAVLEIHGGPHAQYGSSFFHEFQCLAAAGYVVVYSNPRGSKGYGRDHTASIRGAWGTTDWTDIQAVTAFMKKHPSIDAKKMGVMGGSYGGYMTNWVIGHTNDFAGAISDRCVSNIVSHAGNSDYVDEPDRYWEGNFWDRPEARWTSSPMKYIGNCKTPTLLIHSEGDLRCNIEQSDQVFMALNLLKVPCKFVRYPASTSHGMSRSGPADMRLHRLGQILEWWKRWLD